MMKDVEILHTAGLHLGSAFKALPPSFAQLRRRDLVQTFGRLTDMCRDRRTDLFIISGDFWAGENITRPLADFVADQFRKIPSTTVVISPGCADHYHKDSFYHFYPWPENVHIFSQEVEGIDLPRLNLHVFGWALSSPPAPPDWSQLNLSAQVGKGIVIAAYGNPEDLALPQALTGLDNLLYIALGGAHSHTIWDDKVQDPGLPEPLDFSGPPVGNVLAGTVGAERKLTLIPCSSRSLFERTVNLEGYSSLEEAASGVNKELADIRKEDIILLRLTGPRPQKWDMMQLARLFADHQLFFRDETDGPYDLHAIEAEHSRGFLGKYISAIRAAPKTELVKSHALALGVEALLAEGVEQ